MAEAVKKIKGKRTGIIVGGIVVVLAAVLLLLWTIFVYAGGELISRAAVEVDLSAKNIKSVNSLLRLKDPAEIDLRGNEINPEAFETLSEAFPECRILWDVPVAGNRYDSSAEALRPLDFSMADSENWRYFTALTELDLRMMDVSAADYEALQAMLPQCNIRWTIKMGDSLSLSNDATGVSLADAGQTEHFLAAAQNFGHIETIIVAYSNLSTEHYEAIRTAFPTAELSYSLGIAGKIVPWDAEKLDLSGMNSEDVDAVIEMMALLPNVSEAELMNEAGESQLKLDDVLRLKEACPGLRLHYCFEFFGMELSTDMERIEYFSADIGDEGLKEFRRILPIMHSLSYLRLDDCGTSDEEMARFRDENPDIKIVWRIFMDVFSCPTDTLKVWATYRLTNENVAKLKYCTDVKYLDLGHSKKITDYSFLEYMPDLEVAILAISSIENLEPIRNCKKLNFLEVFSSNVTDISPLADLENLEYLNFSRTGVTDITPLFELKKLKHVNGLQCIVPDEQVEKLKELNPDAYVFILPGGNPTDFLWRYNVDGTQTERYKLLTKQIGYDTSDMSLYPRGYVTEEVSMD